uniref:Large ribosomal subunit protein uL23c n=1 Tax=Codium arenicola TaxID=1191365 RepID=A0A2P0QI14_9CHLO|nr:ribosomal protein L23 [Codium arenicola]ARO74395.1 ribosomal protein L23 [Codium arenicola]
MENQKYVFLINQRLTKTHIKYFFEKFYKIQIKKINTTNISRKKLQILNIQSYKKVYKRCIITISQNAILPPIFLKK